MSNQKKQNEKKDGVSPVVVAVTGAVLGAGIAVAGAVAFKDKRNRTKVKEVMTNVKDQALGYMEGMQNQVQDKSDEAEKKLDDGLREAKKATLSA